MNGEMEEADYEAQCQAEAEAEGQAMEAMAAEAENEAMIKNEEIIAQDEFNEKYIEKQKVREVIDKLISKSYNIYSFADEKKIKEVEFFGNDEREIREKGYMRWAFEDGCIEALIKLKKELGLK